MSIYFGVVALIWFLVALRFVRDVQSLPSLPPHTDRDTEPLPRVSVVIAAREHWRGRRVTSSPR